MRINKAVVAAGAVSLMLLSTPGVYAEDEDAARSAILGRTVPADVLSSQRGRAQEVLTFMGIDGLVTDNVAIDTITGKNIITSGAFTNASGLSTAIQNSGNNVLIQNATILLLDVH
jgi:hypothetical protein